MSLLEFLGQTESKEKEKKPRKITLIELISILTEFKCMNQIKSNGFSFYGIMKETTSKKGKKYVNLHDIVLSQKDTEKYKEKYQIQPLTMDKNMAWILVRYIANDPALFPVAYKVNPLVGSVDDITIYSMVEKLTPKKKFYIKGMGKKIKEVQDEKINKISEYFRCSYGRVYDFLETLEETGDIGEFLDFFDYGIKENKKRGKKK